MKKQYELYEQAKDSIHKIIEVIRDKNTTIDVDVDLYFTSYMIERLVIINKLYAEKLKQK